MGVSFWAPNNKECSLLGSILGFRVSWKVQLSTLRPYKPIYKRSFHAFFKLPLRVGVTIR